MSKRIKGGGETTTLENDIDERAVKRRKIPIGNIIDNASDETAETTTQHGLELVKKTTDKNGHLIATDSLHGFEGLSFQQAQEKIVEDTITEKEYEEDDFSAFEPFIKLPSRKEYKDYYNVVTHPMALRDLQKAVKGTRLKTPGISEFKSWSAFEEEASFIWKNAFLYNEDNSDIFKLAVDLKKFFMDLLKKAKAVVPEPVSTKIKLRMPEATKITLKIGKKPSPISSPTPQPVAAKVASDLANLNNTESRNSLGTSPTPVLVSQPEQARSVSGSASIQLAPAKSEEIAGKLPIASGSRSSSALATNVVMPPPTASLPSTHPQSGYAQSYFHQSQPTVPFDSKFRQAGNDAMITNLSIATHPGLNISSHFRMDLPPSETLSQQSVTINLPATHYYLQIKPSISSAMMQRQHKLFVTAGTTRLHAMPTIPGHPVEPRHPLFEARLHPGVNRIEIELVAAVPKESKIKSDIEMEKINVFVNLMKS